MMTTPALDIIARRIKTAQDEGRQIETITSEYEEFDLALGYQVARRIHEARLAEGAVPVGRKIGFTNSDVWGEYGLNAPMWGYLYDTTVVQALDQRVTFELGSLCEPRLEPEVVVHFAASPADSELTSILRCIDWIAHGFEVVRSHFPGWKFKAADAVADSALHGALLVGEPVSVDELEPDPIGKLASFSVTLLRDGEALEVGKGSNVLGNPLSAVAHLIDTLAADTRDAPLQAGELVTTGTLTAAYSVQAGETYTAEFSGIALSGLRIEFER